MKEDDAIALLKKYNISEERIRHSVGVADLAFKIAATIHGNHPLLPVEPVKVKIAALLHDIGRSSPGDHEINTLTILRAEGLEAIADITMHGSFYEIMLLRGIDNLSFKPLTLENKIVAYADARFKNSLISLDERWSEIEKRRCDEPEKIKSVTMSKDRFREIEQELRELTNDSIDL